MPEGIFQATEHGGLYEAELHSLAELKFGEVEVLKYNKAEMTGNNGIKF